MQWSESPAGTQKACPNSKTYDADGKREKRAASDVGKLSNATVRNADPIENTDKIMEWLMQKKALSALARRHGYWSVLLRKGDRHMTAVEIVLGLVEYTRMAMRLKYAGPFFAEHVGKGVQTYT